MAGSIPPLVSSSPPPLCDYDDDDEDDEDDEFGVYNTAQEIDYGECTTFEKKDDIKENHCLPHGEQDSTSQDSATDSGLCPDSEGMSPTPHSDEERTAKKSVCDRLYQKTLDLPVISNCDSEFSDCVGTTNGAKSTIVTHLTNGFKVTENNLTEEVDEDFGNFENFALFCPDSILLERQDSGSQSITVSETLENADLNSKPVKEGNFVVNEQNNEMYTAPVQTSEACEPIDSDNVTLSVHQPSNEFSAVQEDCSKRETENISNGTFHSNEKLDAENEEPSIRVNSHADEVDDDEFNDFASFEQNFPSVFEETKTNKPLHEQSKPISESELSKGSQVVLEESDDEFSNFADFSSSDCAFLSGQSSNSLENALTTPFKPCDDNSVRTDSEFQDWVSVFSSDETCEEVASGQLADLLGKDDVVWCRLFPLEISPALSHQWANSLTNRHLLSALNIDSRNIYSFCYLTWPPSLLLPTLETCSCNLLLFMPWNNSTVPRFAANLARGPLEPVKATELMPLQPTQAALPPIPNIASNPQESVPDAHFDWTGSGLTNPLDYPKTVLNLKKPVSVEAEDILRSLPDISFMRKTYINFPINDA